MSCQEIFVSSMSPHGRLCSTSEANDSYSNHTPLTEAKRQTAEAAKRRAMEILRDALKKKDRVLMEKPQDLFFGDSRDPKFWMERHAILTEELVRDLISELEVVKFKEDLTRKYIYAYVYSKSGDKTVYLCPEFWKASTYLGEGSQPGTLIHEVSHFLGIRDIDYSKASIYVACRGKLVKSKSDPSAPDLNPLGKALLNANNITDEFEITLNHKGRYENGKYTCCGEKAVNSVCERAVPDEFLIHYFRESEKRKNIGEIMEESLLPTAKRLESHVTQLRKMADEIDETHKNATIAKAHAVTSSNKKNEVEKILKECQDMLKCIEKELSKITKEIKKPGEDSYIVLLAELYEWIRIGEILAGSVPSSLTATTALFAAAILVNDSKKPMEGEKLAAEIRREAAKMEEVIKIVNKFYGSVRRL
nr:uncharacterized protein LOC101951602 [Chrysemys picta bellii]